MSGLSAAFDKVPARSVVIGWCRFADLPRGTTEPMSTPNTPDAAQPHDVIGVDPLQNGGAASMLTTAVGGAFTLFGFGITFLSEGGRVPGLVVLVVGVTLLTIGIRKARKHARNLKYRLTRPFSPALFLLAVGATVVFVVGAFVLAWALDMKAAGLLSAAPAVIIPMYMGMRTALIMGRAGIGANGVHLPWSEVAAVEVTHTGADRAEIVIIRHDQAAERIHAPIQGSKLDLGEFADAASRFVPAGTAVVVNGRRLTSTRL